VEGDELQLAPEGRLGDYGGAIHVFFRISGPDALTPMENDDILTCNRCDSAVVWRKR
jgi:hypothetical protein